MREFVTNFDLTKKYSDPLIDFILKEYQFSIDDLLQDARDTKTKDRVLEEYKMALVNTILESITSIEEEDIKVKKRSLNKTSF